VEAVFLDMDQVVGWLEENPSRWTLGPHCEIASDPGQWGHSLVNNAEVLIPCLDAAGARSIVEVGAYAGDVTRLLLDWGRRSGARVWAVDPSPQDSLVRLADAHPELELIREKSLDALRQVPLPDVVVIDGDHNYYTVSEELRLIAEQADGELLPLLIFHDVRWPHARRDHYFAPQLIPAEQRQRTVNGGLVPGDSGVRSDGLPYTSVAANEGGPHNGVLTAVEDFVVAHGGVQLAIVPTFFGLGVVWRRDAPWAEVLAEFLKPYDRNPVLERMEANRILHLASMHSQAVQAMRQSQKTARRDELLRRMLDSRAFAVAERLSRLRRRGDPAFSREEIRDLLNE
jgi:Methyltransferase domain